MPTDIQTVTRTTALRDSTLTPRRPSEEYCYQCRDAASRLLSRLVCLDEKTVDDRLTTSVPRDLAIVLGPWSRQKLVNVLNHLSRGDATTVPPREQSFCLAASYLEERSRSWEIGTGGQALRSKPLISCGMATRATVPACHVELPFGYVRQYSLQLFKPLHVHGSLHRPPPFVSRREPTRLGANCNTRQHRPMRVAADSSPTAQVASLSDGCERDTTRPLEREHVVSCRGAGAKGAHNSHVREL